MTSWTDHASNKNTFFNLPPEKLSDAVLKPVDMDALTPAQQTYLKIMLLPISSTALEIMEEEARLTGSLPARHMPSATSIARSGEHEKMLYKLIMEGDAEAVKSVVVSQKITSTAHPNFGRHRELAHKGRDLSSELGTLNLDAQRHIASTGMLPEENQEEINAMVGMMASMIKPRKKRTRREEFQETVLDMIPVIMGGVKEQADIVKQRMVLLSQNSVDEYGNVKKPEFNSRKQLEALSELLPEFNSWFIDGDGKRTCRVYDCEMAVPGIKGATYQEYLGVLEAFAKHYPTVQQLDTKQVIFDSKHMVRTLRTTIDALGDIELLGAARMDAMNALHAAKDFDPYNTAAKDIYNSALKDAIQASREYMEKLDSKVGNKTIAQILQADTAGEMKEGIGKLLDVVYEGKARIDPVVRESIEVLYTSLHKYGNYAASLQRRENARQYQEVFEYLVENNDPFKKALANGLGISREELAAKLSLPDVYDKAIALTAESSMSEKDPLGVRREFARSYDYLSSKLEKMTKDGQVFVTPLQDREGLAMDALGFFNRARLHPEAFKGGFIIAEFAQPDIGILREGTQDDIKAEVIRLSKSDTLLQLAFMKGMHADGAELMGLHEDPATMRYAPAAQASLRQGPVLQYLQEWAGATTREEAMSNAIHYLDGNGKPEPLTAYQYLLRLGKTEKQLATEGKAKDLADGNEVGTTVAEQKNTYVLRGPHGMEACSDNTKRASAIGLVMAEQSVRDKAIEVLNYPVDIEGQKFAFINPKYLGQGGAIARATGVSMDTPQATWQGEHLMGLTPEIVAHESFNRVLSRFVMMQEAIQRIDPVSKDLKHIISDMPGHASNMVGMRAYGNSDTERSLIWEATRSRIASTRDDDKRYDAYLKDYGSPANNHSARADAKGGAAPTGMYNPGRAIGVAAKEAGSFANVIGVAEIFDVGSKGAGAGEITRASTLEVRAWKDKDSAVQHVLMGAAIIANIIDLERQWAKGGVTYSVNEKGEAILEKNGASTPLQNLIEAYDEGKMSYRDPKTNASFVASDLVMAHLNGQFEILSKGLCSVYKKPSLIELFDEAQRSTILEYKKLYGEVMDGIAKTKGQPGPERQLYEDAYYLLFESGTGIFPQSVLRDQALYEKGASGKNGGGGRE